MKYTCHQSPVRSAVDILFLRYGTLPDVHCTRGGCTAVHTHITDNIHCTQRPQYILVAGGMFLSSSLAGAWHS